MSVSLTHIALHCEDIEASVAFYRDWCGMNITHDRVDNGVRVVWVAEPGKENDFIIVLIGGGHPYHKHPEDFSHIGFDMPTRSDVDAIATRSKHSKKSFPQHSSRRAFKCAPPSTLDIPLICNQLHR